MIIDDIYIYPTRKLVRSVFLTNLCCRNTKICLQMITGGANSEALTEIDATAASAIGCSLMAAAKPVAPETE